MLADRFPICEPARQKRSVKLRDAAAKILPYESGRPKCVVWLRAVAAKIPSVREREAQVSRQGREDPAVREAARLQREEDFQNVREREAARKRAYRQADPHAVRAREASAKRIRRAQPQGADMGFKQDFLDVTFGHSCSVCDRLWFSNSLVTICSIKNDQARTNAIAVLLREYIYTHSVSHVFLDDVVGELSLKSHGFTDDFPSGALPAHHHSPRAYAVFFFFFKKGTAKQGLFDWVLKSKARDYFLNYGVHSHHHCSFLLETSEFSGDIHIILLQDAKASTVSRNLCHNGHVRVFHICKPKRVKRTSYLVKNAVFAQSTANMHERVSCPGNYQGLRC